MGHSLVLFIVLHSCLFFVNGLDLTSSEVFDPVFYANNNPQARLTTVEKAKQHWLSHGIDAGLRGCVQFHSKQYSERYPDIFKAFGPDYRAVVQHYLNHRTTEHRFGLLNTSASYDGRWTVINNGIYLSASTRTGGAVDSLSWNNKEFINSHDHGRQMQMACNTNKYTECYNPTEAGGLCDYDHSTTHTHIDWLHVQNNVLTSQAHPAFWKPVEPTPGTHHNCNYGRLCPIHQGYLTRYDHPLSKTVTVGTHGIDSCIEFISNFTIAGNWPQDTPLIQMESPAVYLTYEFTKAYSYNPVTRLAENYHSNQLPVILSTADHQYALGGYAPGGQNTDRHRIYNHRYFQLSSFADTTGKFNVIFFKRPHGTGLRSYIYRTYMCIGTLNMVTDCLHQIMTLVPK